VTKKKNASAKRKRQRPPIDLGWKISIEMSPHVDAASGAEPTWEARDLLERALVTNLWHRPGKRHHGAIALYSALLERDGLDTEPAIWKTMEFFGVKRSTVFSARKYVLPVINRVLAHMDANQVRKVLQAFDSIVSQSKLDDVQERKMLQRYRLIGQSK
jgi:hypothetical protein